ncbi:MAG: elongation factor P maturation arginine rhamnosyltransferase EarP [Burkholderiales bacterium]
MQWDLFCRVIDNHGDAGVCWRLSADLASRSESVRLWIDDASALQWMAPAGAAHVTVRPWPTANDTTAPGDVVIEAFGCDLPPAFAQRMSAATCWINLEYLSAEAFVERSHGLPSPQANGVRKWFFYPGFTPRTGGLIHEADLLARQQAFDAPAWLAKRGMQREANEQLVSLFCYEQRALPALLDHWARQPTLLLATAGHAQRQIRALLGPTLARGALRAAVLPSLTQREYDELLWACDLNFVRGEDSFVRAQWAGKPFIWQIYPQHDGVHLAKLEAFLDRYLAGAEPPLASRLRAIFRAWNTGDGPFPEFAPPASWLAHGARWRDELRAQSDLTTRLLGFVAETR